MPIRLPRTRRNSSGDAQARQANLAAGDAAGRVDQSDHRKSGDRFAGAGFSDHAQHLALGDVEGDVVDGAQRAAAGDELHLKISHGEDGFGHGRRILIGASG
jgi:hypothetical protein